MASNVIDLPAPRALAIADFKRSGLTEKDFKQMRCRALTSDETEQATNKFRYRSLLIPYFDSQGRETDFFRLRFLEEVRAFGKQKGQRYYQPPDTAPRAYLTPGVDWAKIFGDSAIPLWITEGEKKAARTCKEGLFCLGLGGVWSWRSTKLRQPVIPEILQIDWAKRRVILCFDSDAEAKPDVEGALAMLASTLELRGAEVFRVALPLLGDADKTGLDDYLIAKGGKALKDLPPERLATSAELFKLNEELSIIDFPAAVLQIKTGQLYTNATTLKDIVYSDRRTTIVDAAGRLTDVSAVSQWLRWPMRRRHRGIAYEPGKATVLEDGKFNVWQGWACSPRKGDTTLFDKYLDWLFSGAPEQREWFLKWLAYPLQHPGAKLYTSTLLWSTDEGSGKSLMGVTMKHIYGENYGVVGERQLHSQFNAWMEKKQFIMGEEVTGSDRRGEMEHLKLLVSQETVEVNKKYQVPYEIRNCANFLWTSNHPEAFIMSDKDRRNFVRELSGDKPERKFFKKYVDWLDEREAAPAIFEKLLRVDLTGFDPNGPAPMTDAKIDMVRLGGTEADYLVRSLYESPERYLKVGEQPVLRELWSLEELLAALDPDGRARISRVALAKSLRRQGHRELPMTRTSRGTLRLWAVKNEIKWLAADHGARAGGYDGEEAAKPRKKPGF